jgi:peptidyl-prolyl cis-trans isomerase A (cyclophilin A)
MRHFLILVLFIHASTKCLAQMYADVQTSAGLFTCELNFKETPRTVGSFVSLVEGTRQWVDERTGLLSTIKPPQPFYSGVIFHRVVNDEGFKIIQAGSKRGDGTDGPGYKFRDEMNVSLPATFRFDQPYYLAMANSGFNSNGSQFFITGSAIPDLEGKHTVFGKVVNGQSVIDAILSAEVDLNDKPIADITIQSVTIRRVSKDALSFKASSQKLPTFFVPTFQTELIPSLLNTVRYILKQNKRTELLPFVSIDPAMSNWQQLENRWYTFSPFNLPYYEVSHSPGTPITGFRPIIVKYGADALTPMTPHGYKLLVTNNEGSYQFTFLLDSSVSYVFTPKDSIVPQSGTIPAGYHQFISSPHHAEMTFVFDKQKIVYLELGFDTVVKGVMSGRCKSQVKPYIVIDPVSGFGFYSENFTSPGGDINFSMLVNK